MYKPLASYDTDFPLLEERTVNQTRSMYQVKNPVGIDIEGRPKTITQGEVVLNWQFENALAQNKMLKKIEKKVDSISTNMT